MRYEVRWDAARRGHAIWDTVEARWTEHPAFGLEHVAAGIAESLNLRARMNSVLDRLDRDGRDGRDGREDGGPPDDDQGAAGGSEGAGDEALA